MDKKKLRDRITQLLYKASHFGGMDAEGVDIFVENFIERSYGAGEIIFEEGGAPGNSYLLLEGDVKLTVAGRRIDKFGPGTVFGVDFPIGIKQQLATAVADTDVVLAVIPKKTLYLLSEQDPELFGKIILNVARDLARALKGMKEIIQDFILLEEGDVCDT